MAYEIRNTTDAERTVVSGGCNGPVLVQVVLPSQTRSFMDEQISGSCYDQFEPEVIGAGTSVTGSAVWIAGQFNGPGYRRDFEAELTAELTVGDGGEQVTVTEATTLRVP